MRSMARSSEPAYARGSTLTETAATASQQNSSAVRSLRRAHQASGFHQNTVHASHSSQRTR